MSMEGAIRSALLADAGVSAITTTITPYAIWREDELPAIAYVRASADSWHTYSSVVDYYQGRLQLMCIAGTYSQAKILADAVVSAMDGYSGTVDDTADDTEIGYCRLENLFDQPSPPAAGQEVAHYQVNVILDIMYRDL